MLLQCLPIFLESTWTGFQSDLREQTDVIRCCVSSKVDPSTMEDQEFRALYDYKRTKSDEIAPFQSLFELDLLPETSATSNSSMDSRSSLHVQASLCSFQNLYEHHLLFFVSSLFHSSFLPTRSQTFLSNSSTLLLSPTNTHVQNLPKQWISHSQTHFSIDPFLSLIPASNPYHLQQSTAESFAIPQHFPIQNSLQVQSDEQLVLMDSHQYQLNPKFQLLVDVIHPVVMDSQGFSIQLVLQLDTKLAPKDSLLLIMKQEKKLMIKQVGDNLML
mmetsp:Transcript_8266/g.14962  ORF Transcript_8266/g.14962 Transcript_8266/m.14962 type:complete len:273 (+) Transcript_8266:1592-2410(+)